MNKKGKIKLIALLAIILILALIFGFFPASIITNTTPWVDKELYATSDGEVFADTNYPVQNAFDENWDTHARTGVNGERNIYETSVIDYPADAQLDYIEFYVRYTALTYSYPDGVSSIVKYFVWNYQTSSWDFLYYYRAPPTGSASIHSRTFKIDALNHIQRNQVKLKTQSLINGGYVSITESKVRLSYSLDEVEVDEIIVDDEEEIEEVIADDDEEELSFIEKVSKWFNDLINSIFGWFK